MWIILCMFSSKRKKRNRKVIEEGRRVKQKIYNLPCLLHYFSCPKILFSFFHILNSS